MLWVLHTYFLYMYYKRIPALYVQREVCQSPFPPLWDRVWPFITRCFLQNQVNDASFIEEFLLTCQKVNIDKTIRKKLGWSLLCLIGGQSNGKITGVDVLWRILTNEHDKGVLHASLGRRKLFKEMMSFSLFFVLLVKPN